MSEKLKNCPFCGGKAEIIKGMYRLKAINHSSYKCPIRSIRSNTYEEELEKNWNQRHTDPEEASLIAIGRFSLESTYATLSEYYIADQYCTDDSIFLEAIREHQKEFGNG